MFLDITGGCDMHGNHNANGNGFVDSAKITFKKLGPRHQRFLILKAPLEATRKAIADLIPEFIDAFPELKGASLKRFTSWVMCAKMHRRVALKGKRHKRQLQPSAWAKKDQRY